MDSELNMIINILMNPNNYKLVAPISHIIKREPDFTTLGDACLEVGGDFCEGLFWWYIAWSDAIKALTLKNLTVTRKCTLTNKLIINKFLGVSCGNYKLSLRPIYQS